MLIQKEYFKNIFNTVREAILILDENLRVVSANRSFFETFKVDSESTIGTLLYDLGNGQWNIPYLRVLLEDVLPKNDTVDDYEIEHNFENIGHKTMLLNACKIREKNNDQPIIFLAIQDITEIKEIEAGLEKTRKELVIIKKATDEARDFAENIIDTVRGPLIALDQNLRVVAASRSFYLGFKVTPEETLGQLIYDLGNKQWDIPKLRELLETILPQQTTFDNYEVEHNFTAIGRRIMLLNARQIHRVWGKELIILLAIEDITERKRLEDLLAESEMQYRRLFETASDGIVLLEKGEGHIVHANPAAEKMLGYSKEEYVGKKLRDIGVSLDMTDFSAVMQDLNRSGILNYEDVPIKTRSGLYIEADIYMVDRAKLAQFNIRNVSERKRALDALQKSEERFRQIAESAEEWIWEIDNDGLYTYASKVVEKILGYRPEEVVGKLHFYDFYPINKREQMKKEAFEVFAAKNEFKKYINSNLHKNGNIVLLETSGSPIFNSKGDLLGYRGVYVDITEQKKLEAQLRHAQKMEAVGTLAGGIAHDFNNILNVIMGYGTMVMDRIGADQLSKEQMNEILSAVDRGAALTNRLLIFSRKQAVELKPININELILGLQKMLVRIIRESIDFKLELAESPLIVLGDAGQIEQVLMNLASNARDAILDGGCLTIVTGNQELDEEYVGSYGYGKPGMYALITVTDTGQGMDAETQKKIFEPFFTTKEIGEGTGLGLAISYGIIKQHNGYIKVYSEPGKGTTFKIWLPVIEGKAEKRPKLASLAYPKGGTETILVAEDDASLRKLSRTVLESHGYSVITAEDGEDAITKFMENRARIALVVLDMIMPKKNGKEVCEAIRKKSPQTKVLFSSGYAMDIIKTGELTEAGFDFILKPVMPRDLLKKVRDVLDR